MQRQDETMQIGAISPNNPGIKRGDDRLALRRLPALPPIARHLRAQAQVLNHDLLVAFVARAGRHLRPDNNRRPDRQLVQLAAASTARLLPLGVLGSAAPRNASVRCLVHAGRLLRRSRRQVLQPCKLILDGLMFSLELSEGAAELLILCPQPPNLANQLANHANQVRLRQTFQRIRGTSSHPQLESHFRALDSPLARKCAPVTCSTSYEIGRVSLFVPSRNMEIAKRIFACSGRRARCWAGAAAAND